MERKQYRPAHRAFHFVGAPCAIRFARHGQAERTQPPHRRRRQGGACAARLHARWSVSLLVFRPGLLDCVHRVSAERMGKGELPERRRKLAMVPHVELGLQPQRRHPRRRHGLSPLREHRAIPAIDCEYGRTRRTRSLEATREVQVTCGNLRVPPPARSAQWLTRLSRGGRRRVGWRHSSSAQAFSSPERLGDLWSRLDRRHQG